MSEGKQIPFILNITTQSEDGCNPRVFVLLPGPSPLCLFNSVSFSENLEPWGAQRKSPWTSCLWEHLNDRIFFSMIWTNVLSVDLKGKVTVSWLQNWVLGELFPSEFETLIIWHTYSMSNKSILIVNHKIVEQVVQKPSLTADAVFPWNLGAGLLTLISVIFPKMDLTK